MILLYQIYQKKVKFLERNKLKIIKFLKKIKTPVGSK